MTVNEYERLRLIDISNLCAELKSIFHKKELNGFEPVSMILAAYLLLLSDEHKDVICDNFYDFCAAMFKYSPKLDDNQMAYDFSINEGERSPLCVSWKEISGLSGRFTHDELAACVLFGAGREPVMYVPDSLSKLVYKILNPEKDETISSIVSEDGSFLSHCWLYYPEAKYEGFPIHYDDRACAQARANIIGADYDLEEELYYPPHNDCDKLFCYFPSMERYQYLRPTSKDKGSSSQNAGTAMEKASFEWWYSNALLEAVKQNGKLACVMNASCLISRADAEAREYFVENGLIESVTILPEKLYPDKRRRLALVVFSRDNKSIRFLNAVHNAEASRFKGKKIEIITDKNIREILDCSGGISLSVQKLRENFYCLDSLSDFENVEIKTSLPTVQLNMLTDKMFRGSQEALSNTEAKNETAYVWVMPSDLQDGVIAGPLNKYIQEAAAAKLENYVLREGDILISRTGYRAKDDSKDAPVHFDVAVFENNSETKKIANGGLYVIRPNYEKGELSYFIKAFLESPMAQKILTAKSSRPNGKGYESGYRGGVILPLGALREISIPFPEQNIRAEIEVQCRELSQQIMKDKKEIEESLSEISGLFEDNTDREGSI